VPLPRFQNLEPEKQDAILRAAAQEFAEHGFAQASFNRIIKSAGVSKGAMYYYFSDKDDLFRTVLSEATRRWLAEVGLPFEADGPAAYWDALESLYARSLRFMLRDPMNAALCLSISRARERLEGHPALLEQQELMVAWTEQLIRQGKALGAITAEGPEDLLVQAAIAIMDAGDRWLATRWGEMSEDDVEPTARLMIGMFRRLGGDR
jgi:TetR/AcrR family transcriptional regulator